MKIDMRDIIVSDGETEYRLHRRWELKRSELSTLQKREARGFLYGFFKQKKDFFTEIPIYPRLLHSGSIDIHHLVELGKEGCNLLINLRLAYHGPNANAGKPSTIQKPERENTRKSVSFDATESLHRIVPYDQGSPEMQANDIGIPKLVDFWCQVIQDQGSLTRFAALNSGANACGLTYQPVLRHFNKVVYQKQKMGEKDDPLMAFEEEKNERHGVRWVKLRKGWKIAKVGKYLRPMPSESEK